jgi:hypothetical protein
MSPFRITGYTHSTPEFERLEQLNKDLIEVVELILNGSTPLKTQATPR